MAKAIVAILTIIAIILGVWTFYDIVQCPGKPKLPLKILLCILLIMAEFVLFMLLFVALM